MFGLHIASWVCVVLDVDSIHLSLTDSFKFSIFWMEATTAVTGSYRDAAVDLTKVQQGEFVMRNLRSCRIE